MLAVPRLMPHIAPVEVVTEPAVATATLLLLHVPPAVVWLSVVHEPIHVLGTPVGAGGVEMTVTIVVIVQPPNR
jgi:hypothetical protein